MNKVIQQRLQDQGNKVKQEIASFYAENSSDNVLQYSNLLETMSKSDVALLYEKEELFFMKYPEYDHLRDTRKNYYKIDKLQGLQKSIQVDLMDMGATQSKEMRQLLESIASKNLGGINTDLIKYVDDFNWVGNVNWNERIWGNSDKLRSKLNEHLNDAFLRGDSIDSIIKDVKVRFGSSYSDASRLVLTESAALHNTATLDRYAQMGVTEVEFSAILDDRTSEKCANAEGNIIKIEDAKIGTNAPPLHPYCRSVLLPVVDTIKQVAYEEYEKIGNALTDDEQYALNSYMSSESYKINEKLRNGMELDQTESDFVKDLDSALQKIPKYAGPVVRDVSFGYNEDMDNFIDDYGVGKIVDNRQYLSATAMESYHESPSVRFHILSSNGRDLTTINKSESEVLFPRGSKLRVVAQEINADGIIEIFLREVK